MKFIFSEILHIVQLLLIRTVDSFVYVSQILYTSVSKIKEFLYLPNEDTEKFDIILNKIAILQERLNQMTNILEALTSEVTRVQTVHASTIKLIGGLVDQVVAAKNEIAALNANSKPPVDVSALDALVDSLKASTDSLAMAVTDSADLKPTHTVILNADNPEVPTVEVVMPEVLPEVVKVEVETVVDVVDPASPEPQIVITVVPSTEEAVKEEDVVTEVIKTEEGLTDVVVAAPSEVHEEVKAETGIDVVEAVVEAYEAAPEVEAAPEAPPADFATTPETGGAPLAGLDGTQAGATVEAPATEEPQNPYKD